MICCQQLINRDGDYIKRSTGGPQGPLSEILWKGCAGCDRGLRGVFLGKVKCFSNCVDVFTRRSGSSMQAMEFLAFQGALPHAVGPLWPFPPGEPVHGNWTSAAFHRCGLHDPDIPWKRQVHMLRCAMRCSMAHLRLRWCLLRPDCRGLAGEILSRWPWAGQMNRCAGVNPDRASMAVTTMSSMLLIQGEC